MPGRASVAYVSGAIAYEGKEFALRYWLTAIALSPAADHSFVRPKGRAVVTSEDAGSHEAAEPARPATCVVDANGLIVEWSDAAERLLGYPA
ncbi:PAS domain-containing protein [Streptomyces sp. NPDC058293]|uniref:PAS domain-containing protein n=1 Tax=Streptomyces sp. NPDC058293 TaxID=3346429 RepID=UPI0036EA3295